MPKTLCLAPSGFGKTAGIGEEPELGLIGLPVKQTYIISVTSKPLTFANSSALYPIVPLTQGAKITEDLLKKGRRIITNVPGVIAEAMDVLSKTPLRYVVWDDANYVMQDYFMKNALRTGWDAPKKIGFDMSRIFEAMEKYQSPEKHIIVLAHGENVTRADGRIYTKFKTTGKMVDEYLTPEGKFDVVLVGESRWDSGEKKAVKEYYTRETEFLASPKSPYGMFDTPAISNDLGKIVKRIDEFYKK